MTVHQYAVATGYRGSVKAAAFDSSDVLITTGSQDGYIKVFDVEKIIQRGLEFYKLPPDQMGQVRPPCTRAIRHVLARFKTATSQYVMRDCQ